MKKLIASLILVLAATSFGYNADAKVQINQRGDTTEIIDGADTTLFVGKASIINKAKAALDDTIYNANAVADEADNHDGSVVEYDDADQASQQQITGTFDTNFSKGIKGEVLIVGIIFITILLIVFISLLFSYKSRKRQYEVMERAIENGQPIDPRLFGGNAAYQQAPPMPPFQGAPLQGQPIQVQPAQGQPMYGAPSQGQTFYTYPTLNNYISGGVKITIVGAAITLFFFMAGAEPVCAITSILIFMGAWKIYSGYNNYVQAKNIYDHNMSLGNKPQPNGQGTATPPPFTGDSNTQDNNPIQ